MATRSALYLVPRSQAEADRAALPAVEYDVDRPWTRQPCDSDQLWAAWLIYRDMPERNISEVARRVDRAPSQVLGWSQRALWTDRALAYDRYLDDIRVAHVAAIVGEDSIERAARHLTLVRKMWRAAEHAAHGWLQRIEQGQSLAEFRPRDVLAIVSKAVELDRLIHGETTAKVEVAGGGKGTDLSGLTDRELLQYRRLLAKVEGSPPVVLDTEADPEPE